MPWHLYRGTCCYGWIRARFTNRDLIWSGSHVTRCQPIWSTNICFTNADQIKIAVDLGSDLIAGQSKVKLVDPSFRPSVHACSMGVVIIINKHVGGKGKGGSWAEFFSGKRHTGISGQQWLLKLYRQYDMLWIYWHQPSWPLQAGTIWWHNISERSAADGLVVTAGSCRLGAPDNARSSPKEPELSPWSAINALWTGDRRTFQRDSGDHGGAVVGRTWPDITETNAHQTACYPFQTLLNTKRQTWPKRTSPSHRSMRLFTLSMFTLSCSLTTRWTHLNYNSRLSLWQVRSVRIQLNIKDRSQY